jgi:predicted SPOUT superfamily RNA methylase MTH1
LELSNELISQFVKATKDDEQPKTGTVVNGTTVEYNGKTYVKIDGSELLTPVNTTAAVKPGERVTVTIKDHTATVTGNLTSPSASDSDVQEIGNKISEFEIVVADKVSTKELDAQVARIDELRAENVSIKGRLDAGEASIGELETDNVTIKETLTANKASIDNLEATKISAEVADAKYATIENLDAANADIYNLNANYATFKTTTTDKLTAIDASITDLDTTKLDAESAEITYANIDFSNIGKAAIEYFYSKSGLIKDVVVGDGTVTGELVGVTIKGDLIEGNTIKAEKLVIKGTDGLYYKLNTDGVTTEAEQTNENSLDGSHIMAKSITATKIAVDDLVAFDATIGGFNITSDAIYSGVKDSPTNTTRGIYMDNQGQLAVGDSNNFLRYYKDQNGSYKLEISANSVTMSAGGTTIEDEIANIKDEMATIQDEVTTLLRIESSRGTVFKNDQVSTVLSAVIYRGSKRITDIQTLKSVMGNSAYLEWSWQHLNDDSYGIISADDSRIGNDGFTFTLSPADVNTKVTFMCTLNT